MLFCGEVEKEDKVIKGRDSKLKGRLKNSHPRSYKTISGQESFGVNSQ